RALTARRRRRPRAAAGGLAARGVRVAGRRALVLVAGAGVLALRPAGLALRLVLRALLRLVGDARRLLLRVAGPALLGPVLGRPGAHQVLRSRSATSSAF